MRDSEDVKVSGDVKAGEAIEKLLAGLRHAEAPAGMERRILEKLEGRVSVEETRSRQRRLVSAWMTLPTKALICGVGLVALVAMILAIPAVRRLAHVPAQSKSGGVTGMPVSTEPAMAAKEAELSSGGSRVKFGTTAKVPDAGLVRVAESPEADSNDESLARSEMEAASFPAPPMPLTAQERLLLRLARKADPVEIAMLDPKFRAMQDAKEKAEFQRFFGQSATKPVAPVQAPGGESNADQAAQPSPMEQGVTTQPVPEQGVPTQPAMDQAAPTQDQPIQKQAAPEPSSPDQSTMQQPTARPTGTGENE
jgi:hypothetical protein